MSRYDPDEDTEHVPELWKALTKDSLEKNRDDMDLIWVCGGVDSYGAVTGHEARQSIKGSSEHTYEEKCLTSFRWNVREQFFMPHFSPQKRQWTEDEGNAIVNWLIKHNYRGVD